MTLRFEDWNAGQFATLAATQEGRKCFELLASDAGVNAMSVASDLGHPALVAMEDRLLAELGSWILQDRNKQMAGAMTRSIMEQEGFEVDKHNVTVASQPFHKATRYRRPGRTRIHAFRSTSNPRDVCLTARRSADMLPADAKWRFWATITSKLQACVAYDIYDFDALVIELEAGCYRRVTLKRAFRGASAAHAD